MLKRSAAAMLLTGEITGRPAPAGNHRGVESRVSVRAVRVGSGQGHCTRWNNVSSPAFRKRPNGGTLVGRLAVGDGSIRLTVSVNTLVTPASPPNTLRKRIPVLERGGRFGSDHPRARPLNASKGEADAVGVKLS